MPESPSAEMPKVDDTIPKPEPGESPEAYRQRLVAMRHEEQSTLDRSMKFHDSEGTFRDPKPSSDKTPEEPQE